MDFKTIRMYGSVIISIITSLIFIGLLVAVMLVKDQDLHKNLMIALVQSGIVNFTQVVGYWIGSSAGSAQKDEQPSAAPRTPTAPPPGTP